MAVFVAASLCPFFSFPRFLLLQHQATTNITWHHNPSCLNIHLYSLTLFCIDLFLVGKCSSKAVCHKKKQILWIMEFHNFIINEGQRNTQHNHQSLKKQCYKLLSNIVPFLPSSCRLQTQGSQQHNFPLPEMINMCHCPAIMSGTL